MEFSGLEDIEKIKTHFDDFNDIKQVELAYSTVLTYNGRDIVLSTIRDLFQKFSYIKSVSWNQYFDHQEWRDGEPAFIITEPYIDPDSDQTSADIKKLLHNFNICPQMMKLAFGAGKAITINNDEKMTVRIDNWWP